VAISIVIAITSLAVSRFIVFTRSVVCRVRLKVVPAGRSYHENAARLQLCGWITGTRTKRTG